MADYWYKSYLENKVENANLHFLQISKINKKISMHSKAILVDEKYLFIWSENFSEPSLDKNREMWLLLKNEDIIKKFIKIFESDK
jgi:phosphatidylserine/phosphatidylglycerophosphate/cardiolipin synthase-like enzyme